MLRSVPRCTVSMHDSSPGSPLRGFTVAVRTGLRHRVVRAGAAAQLDDGIRQRDDLDVVARAGTVGREQRSVPVSVQLLVGHRASRALAGAHVRFLRERVVLSAPRPQRVINTAESRAILTGPC